MTTTQQTYLHIIKELENQDKEKVMQISSLIDAQFQTRFGENDDR